MSSLCIQLVSPWVIQGAWQMAIPLLANEFVTVHDSHDPERIFACTPGLARLEGGRLVGTMN